MNFSLLTAVATAALTAAAISTVPATPALAADLNGPRGSAKDGYVPAMPMRQNVSNCYVRGDVGGSFSNDPTAKWPMSQGTFTDGNADGIVDPGELNFAYIGNKISNASLDNTWLIEGGYGCGSGSRGLRAEAVLGYRGQRSLSGSPLTWNPGPSLGQDTNVDPYVPATGNTLHSALTTYTAMINAYYDLGRYGAFVPYVGAGIGLAYHKMGEVTFDGNPYLSGIIAGDNDVAFAWSLMAGVAYQVSDRAILDFGYRYVDLGSVASARHDNVGVVTNPKVTVEDITAHEFKIGLRYHLGSGGCCETVSLK